MKKRFLQFRNQLLILGVGSMLIVSCTKEEMNDFFDQGSNNTVQTDSTNNGSNNCITCGENTTDSIDGGGSIVDSSSNEGGEYTNDSTYVDGGGNEVDSTSNEGSNNSVDSLSVE